MSKKMNPIKAFYKKITDKKSKGHRLNEEPPSNIPKKSNASSSKAVPHHSGPAVPNRCEPSESAQRAGAAALARVEQRQQPTVNWSLAATKAQARKELELEHSVKMKCNPKEVIEESCPKLSVSGVYFSCPMVSPEILPFKEIQAKIKEFLYEQLEEERGLTACLIIHTCNKNKEKVNVGAETLARYLTNIIDNPTEAKFRKIRIRNKVFQEKVAELEGAFDFLIAAGFSHQMINQGDGEEEYFVFEDEELNLENLQMLKEALLSAEKIVPTLDRNMKVLRPLQVSGEIQLPNDFFHLSAAEVQREQEAKTEAVELGKVLRTKAMRERDEIKEFHKYKYTLLRIRCDEIILQGTFHVIEKLSAVKEFIVEHLACPDREYQLSIPGSDRKLTEEDNQTLLDLKLVPAAILILTQKKNNPEEMLLNSETMILLEDEKWLC